MCFFRGFFCLLSEWISIFWENIKFQQSQHDNRVLLRKFLEKIFETGGASRESIVNLNLIFFKGEQDQIWGFF